MKRTLAIGISIAILLTGCSAKSSPNPVESLKPGQGAAAPMGGTFLNEKIPANILAIPFFDSAGKSFTLGSLSGKTVVLSNFLTSCQEICPMTTANMRDIGDAVAASSSKNKVEVLELSVDAQRDNVSRLKAYAALFNDSNFTLASGTLEGIKDFWTYFGAPPVRVETSKAEAAKAPVDWQTGKPLTYDISHADLVVIISPDSKWSWLDLGSPSAKSPIPAKLKAFLNEDGLANLVKAQEPSWNVPTVLAALSQLVGSKIS